MGHHQPPCGLDLPGAPLGLWAFWGVVFCRAWSPDDPLSSTRRMADWLLRGSILEVVVAIPSHIISRNRDECCAPVFGLVGIVTGLSVALMAFGPALFLLFVRRMRSKRAAARPAAP